MTRTSRRRSASAGRADALAAATGLGGADQRRAGMMAMSGDTRTGERGHHEQLGPLLAAEDVALVADTRPGSRRRSTSSVADRATPRRPEGDLRVERRRPVRQARTGASASRRVAARLRLARCQYGSLTRAPAGIFRVRRRIARPSPSSTSRRRSAGRRAPPRLLARPPRPRAAADGRRRACTARHRRSR